MDGIRCMCAYIRSSVCYDSAGALAYFCFRMKMLQYLKTAECIECQLPCISTQKKPLQILHTYLSFFRVKLQVKERPERSWHAADIVGAAEGLISSKSKIINRTSKQTELQAYADTAFANRLLLPAQAKCWISR